MIRASLFLAALSVAMILHFKAEIAHHHNMAVAMVGLNVAEIGIACAVVMILCAVRDAS